MRKFLINANGEPDHECCHHVAACRFVRAERERELLELKGPCSSKSCRLHYAHSGPCAPLSSPESAQNASVVPEGTNGAETRSGGAA